MIEFFPRVDVKITLADSGAIVRDTAPFLPANVNVNIALGCRPFNSTQLGVVGILIC
jgi:hypothetical protein